MAEDRFEYLLQLRDELSGPLSQLNAGPLSGFIGLLGKSQLGMAGVAAATVAAVGGLASLTKALGDEAEQFQNMSMQTGLATRDLQVFRLIAKESGVDSDAFTGALVRVNSALGKGIDLFDDAAEGTGKFTRTLKQLGVDVGPTAADTLVHFKEALDRINNPAKSAQIILDAFGLRGRALVPILANTKLSLGELREELVRTGAVLDDQTLGTMRQYDEAWDQLTRKIEIATVFLKGFAAVAMLPVIHPEIGGGSFPASSSLGTKAGINVAKYLETLFLGPVTTLITRPITNQFTQPLETGEISNWRKLATAPTGGLLTGTEYGEFFGKYFETMKARATQLAEGGEAGALKLAQAELEKAVKGFDADAMMAAAGKIHGLKITQKIQELTRQVAVAGLEGIGQQLAAMLAAGADLARAGMGPEAIGLQVEIFRRQLAQNQRKWAAEYVGKGLYQPWTENLLSREASRRMLAGPFIGISPADTGADRLKSFQYLQNLMQQSAVAMAAPGRAAQMQIGFEQDRAMIELEHQRQLMSEENYEKAKLAIRTVYQRKYLEAELQLHAELRQSAASLFDAMVTRGIHGIGDFVKGLGLTQIKSVFANLAVELFGGLQKVLGGIIPGQTEIDPATGQPKRTRLGRILAGTVFGTSNEQILAQSTVLNTTATDRNTIAVDRLTSAIGGNPLQGGADIPNLLDVLGKAIKFPDTGTGGSMVFGAFPGLGGGTAAAQISRLAPVLGGLIGGKGGLTIGSAVAGGIYGATANAGAGIGGLGHMGGALLGAGIAGGVAALALYGIPALVKAIFGGVGYTPQEGERRTREILASHAYTAPESQAREMAMGGGMGSEIGYGFGNVPRVVHVSYHVAAIDARGVQEFFDRHASELTRTIGRALSGCDPLRFALKEISF